MNAHGCEFANCLFFFFLAAPMAYGNSQARDGIQAPPMSQLKQRQFLNPLHLNPQRHELL